MAKYKGTTKTEPIQESGKVNDDGCAQYSFFNAGNVNVTIDEVRVLLPRQTYTGPDLHPDVAYHDTHSIVFDGVNAPTTISPSGGNVPQNTTLAPGAVPNTDRRLLFTKVFIK